MDRLQRPALKKQFWLCCNYGAMKSGIKLSVTSVEGDHLVVSWRGRTVYVPLSFTDTKDPNAKKKKFSYTP